jgi:16S rRNA (cytosine1402-N4)-methyltransferase
VEGEVKSDFYGKIERPFEQINKGVITPSEDEMAKNGRARSAKLRIGIRK